nr:hypothetical protein [uncultured Chitinophaga sp.]
MRKLIILFVALLSTGVSHAQLSASDPQLQQAIALINKLQRAALAPQSYRMEYRYSNESTPYLLLDSLEGKMVVDSNRYLRIVGNNEVMHNSRYDVAVFKEDSLIYVSNATAIAQNIQPLNSVQALLRDSLLAGCNISNNGHTKSLRFLFSPGAPCKSIELVADTVAMRVDMVNMVVKTVLMTMSGTDPGSGYEEYALMKVVFSGYQSLKPGAVAAVFDEKKYFHKTDKGLKPAEAYAGYQVFSGSPQLQ